MSLNDLLPALKSLSRADKLRAIQALAADMESDEDALQCIAEGGIYPIWSPFDSLRAAGVLQGMLEQEGAAS